jgi:competence protein ComEC
LLLFYLLKKQIFSLYIDICLILILITAASFAFMSRDCLSNEWKSIEKLREHYGILLQEPFEEKDKQVFTLRLVSPDSSTLLPYVAKVYAEEIEKSIGYGDLIRFKGRLKSPPGLRNPGGFNYRSFLRRKGIFYLTYISEGNIEFITSFLTNPFITKILFPIKHYCVGAISKNLDDVHSSLLKGLTVGLRGDIPDNIKEIFSDAGVIHILAVSGLHVGIISFFLFVLFRSLHIPFNVSILLSCVFLIIYAFMTGLRPSVIRATIMFIFIMMGTLGQRRVIVINTIAVSAILILIFNPLDLFDAGFQLSYVATFSIVILYRRIYDYFPQALKKIKVVSRFLLLPLSVTIAAQLGTAPVIAYYFFKVPLASSISNLVIVPFVSLVIPSGFLTVLGNVIHHLIADIFAGANWILLHIIIKLSTFFSTIPNLRLWVRRPPFLFFLLYYPVLFTFFLMDRKKRIKYFVFTSLIIANIFMVSKLYHLFSPQLTVNFLDVSQGDASVIEFPHKQVCVIDGGKRSYFIDYGERVLIPFFRSKGIRTINTIIATHPDVDHYGGLITVMEKFKVDKLVVNGSPKRTYLYQKLLNTARRKGVSVYNVHKGEVLWIGDYPFYMLNPPVLRGSKLPSNEGSIVVKFGYGNVTFLFTGDYPNRIFRIPHSLLDCTVLKFPHHGAKFFHAGSFLTAVDPEITTISVGGDNRFGHPVRENIHILNSLGSQIYRTDRDGAIILSTDGKTIKVKKMKGN